jgi:hypothetical protein
MFVPFESLAPTSRLWIYQADRKFSSEEKAIIESKLKLFTDEWAAHGQALRSSFQIAYDQFIILAADEAVQSASGCSIDDSVRFVQEIGSQLEVDFFNRNLIAFKEASGIRLIRLTELKQKLAEGVWSANSLMFNNLVSQKSALETDWVIPSSSSWLSRYIGSEKVAH